MRASSASALAALARHADKSGAAAGALSILSANASAKSDASAWIA